MKSIPALLPNSASFISQSQEPSLATIALRFKKAEGDKRIPSPVAYSGYLCLNPIRSKSAELPESASLMWREPGSDSPLPYGISSKIYNELLYKSGAQISPVCTNGRRTE
jgi:hypothetical protein